VLRAADTTGRHSGGAVRLADSMGPMATRGNVSRVMGWIVASCVLSVTAFAAPVAQTTHATGRADSVLAALEAGNRRHVSARYRHPHQTASRRHELARGQLPNAVILTCADSRVPPEIVFDQGLGDLFVVRVAGNIATDAEIASIEYAVEHLHASLVVVMGHQACGAVAAAVEGGEAPGHLPTLIDAIRPAVDKARKLPGNLTDNAIRTNAEMVVEQLRSSHPVLAEAVTAGTVRIVGAVYSLDTGAVTWLPSRH
jgi:carbonic anhydrase